jgi:hypothetical protein
LGSPIDLVTDDTILPSFEPDIKRSRQYLLDKDLGYLQFIRDKAKGAQGFVASFTEDQFLATKHKAP